MDNLKLHAENDEELEGLLSKVKIFCDDIDMEMDLDNTNANLGILTSTSETKLDESTSIRKLDQVETYKYLKEMKETECNM